MGNSYRLLFHQIFIEQSTQVCEEHLELKKPLATALQEIASDPTYGKMMRGVNNPHLQGNIRRVHVKGRKGHRLLYILSTKKKLVLPILLSPTPKSNFDYDKIDWEGIAARIYDDLMGENYDAFAR